MDDQDGQKGWLKNHLDLEIAHPAIQRVGGKKRELGRIRYQYLRYDGKLDGYFGSIDTTSRYTKIIPEAVLTTAETILKHFEATDPICLLVTDYAVIQPDPFLAVAIPDYPFLIVDFWDEPGFQPKAAETDSQKGLNK